MMPASFSSRVRLAHHQRARRFLANEHAREAAEGMRVLASVELTIEDYRALKARDGVRVNHAYLITERDNVGDVSL